MSLWLVKATDGRRLGEYQFDSVKVFDGRIGAAGPAFIATRDGQVVCFGTEK